jgi:hypothetical protein
MVDKCGYSDYKWLFMSLRSPECDVNHKVKKDNSDL